ncbi:MAG: transaldolase [Armatimonadetes bacterium]|nr:transaldolase [Armatimonadota bacterium]MDE2205537.1 transaldolase [Armatimonadota bacterium]
MSNLDYGPTKREALVHELACSPLHSVERVAAPPSDPGLARLNELGTRVWYDTGKLEEAEKIWRLEASALTTNNTLANQVVQSGIMDDVIQRAIAAIRESDPSGSEADLVMDAAFVVNCHIALRLIQAFDVLVSVELHPSVSHDMERTVRYAQRYYAVNPEHFIVKIPLTPEGYCAVARARAMDIPINYTLGFSARQNYLAAMVSDPSFVNVFLGRLNQVIVENHLGDGRNAGEKTTLASQAGLRSARSSRAGIGTRQIAASMRGGEQMAALAGVDVFTAPPSAVAEFLAAGYKPADLVSHVDDQLEVAIADPEMAGDFERLWAIDETFQQFTASLASRGGTVLHGDDLREADRDFGTRMFAAFTPEEQSEIRSHGKIPNLARWRGRAAIDDLMTESAMQSFTTDQAALDGRIRSVGGIGAA